MGFYAATRQPGGLYDPGPPPQAVWVGEDRACPPCPRVGRSLPTPRGARPAVAAPTTQESRRGWGIDTRLAPGACSGAPERPGIDATISQRQPCGPGTAHRSGRHRAQLRAARWCGLRDEVAVPPRHWHPTAMPPALNRATQAPRPRSARAPRGRADHLEAGTAGARLVANQLRLA